MDTGITHPFLRTMKIHPALKSIHRAGFTLVELVVVVTILIIIAGLAVPRVGSWTDKAKLARAENDLKAIRRSLEYMYQDMGVYPRDASPGVDPGLVSNALVPASRRADWSGPYLEVWPAENPWGGSYDYEYWNYSAFNMDGTAGNEVLISLRSGLTASICQDLDEMMDDGNGSTGMVRHNNSSWLGFYVSEGIRW